MTPRVPGHPVGLTLGPVPGRPVPARLPRAAHPGAAGRPVTSGRALRPVRIFPAPPPPLPAPVPPLADDGLELDVDARSARLDGVELVLTYLEFELLAHLVAHPRRVFTRRQLMDVVWGYPDPGGGRTVDVHIARLRRKIGARHRGRLVTVHRVGYKYQPPPG